MKNRGGFSLVGKILFVILPAIFIAGVGFFVIQSFKKADNTKVKADVANEEIAGAEDIANEIEVEKAFLAGKEELSLSVEYSGIVDEIFIEEGMAVEEGVTIARIDVKTLVLEKKKLESILRQARYNLEKVGAGATKEDIDVSETKKDKAEDSLDAARDSVVDAIRGVFTAADDAIRAKTNPIFTNAESQNPQLNFTPSPSSLESEIESQRIEINNEIDSFADMVNSLDRDDDLEDKVGDTRDIIGEIQDYLDDVSLAVNSLTVGEISQETIDSWKTLVSAGRSGIEASKVVINEAYADLNYADSYFSISEDELEYKKAISRREDIMIAQAKVDEIEAEIGVLEEKINKANIVAPFDGVVMKIWPKKGELIPAYSRIVTFSTESNKVIADVLEDDIRDVKLGKNVRVEFRAFPEKSFSGSITSIEPHRVIIDGDVYYKVYVELDNYDPELRPGMTADVFLKKIK